MATNESGGFPSQGLLPMPKPKKAKPVLDAASGPDDVDTSTAVISTLIESAQKKEGVDKDLLAILEKHILVADPKQNACESAVAEMQRLAQMRAATIDEKK